MKILKCKQGTPEWHEIRATTHNASEAPAMMGVSRHLSRHELIKNKALGLVPEIDEATQRRFDRGHETEALARALVEERMGLTLYPLVATDDDGYLLASSDGCTLPPAGGIGFEHKLWNEELAESVRNGIVPESHTPQLDQQIAVFGLEKILFVVSDGTEENMVMCEYRTTTDKITALMAGWAQFDKDVADYVHVEAKEKPAAAVIDALPTLYVEVSGQVLASNLSEFKQCALARIGAINTDLVTDQDFADAEAAEKWLKDVEARIDSTKKATLEQTQSIDELFRMLDEIKRLAADTRKTLSGKIKSEKETRRAELIAEGKAALDRYVTDLNASLNGHFPRQDGDFAGAIKGMKKLENMKGAIQTELARAKIEADRIAGIIRENRAFLIKQEADYGFLFPDLRSVIAKPTDDFSALVVARIAQHKEAQAKKAEGERKRTEREQAQAMPDASAAPAPPVLPPAKPVPHLAAVPAEDPIGPRFRLLDSIEDALNGMEVDELRRVLAFAESVISERQFAAA